MDKYLLDSPFVRKLDEEIEEFMNCGVRHHDDAGFNRLALLQFEYQYHANRYYREYCEFLNRSPENVGEWWLIPPMPSRAFKENLVVSFPLDKTKLFSMTSGTTDPSLKGQLYRDQRGAELHYKANILATKWYLFPDVQRMQILLMVPSPEIAPHMGMAIGLTIMKEEFGTGDSAYLITKQGLNVPYLISALREAEERGCPVALVGATSGFVVLFNQFRSMGLRFRLPHGSRIADGGGYTGTFGDCSRDELLGLACEFLNIEPDYLINTFGTAESASNYFDHNLCNAWLGLPEKPRCKAALPWTRIIAADPITLKRLPHGQPGLLCFYDLANRSTVLAVKTDNFGYTTEAGFEIIGRTEGLTGGHPAGISMGNHPVHGKFVNHPEACSTVADVMLNIGEVCSTVADSLLKPDRDGKVCSTVADILLKSENNDKKERESNL